MRLPLRQLEVRAAGRQSNLLQAAVPEGAPGQCRDRSLRRVRVDGNVGAFSAGLDALLAEPGGDLLHELHRVELHAHGFVATGLDTRAERELVDEITELARSRADHL